jgi:hypothetical protein
MISSIMAMSDLSQGVCTCTHVHTSHEPRPPQGLARPPGHSSQLGPNVLLGQQTAAGWKVKTFQKAKIFTYRLSGSNTAIV